jgi:hypothetical protein
MIDGEALLGAEPDRIATSAAHGPRGCQGGDGSL